MNLRLAAVMVGMIGLGASPAGVVAQKAASKDSTTQTATAPTVRLSQAMPTSYDEPSCLSSSGLNRIKEAISSLKEALKGESPAARAQALQNSKRSLVEAIVKGKQDRNASAWYTLGQVHLYEDDAVGADSALRRVTTLAPGCKTNVEELRYRVWAPLINTGIDFTKAKNNDSALMNFRQAAAIYPDKPHAALNAGVIFANTKQFDSAAVYFRQSADASERANMVTERNQSTFNLAAMLQQSGRHVEAAQVLEKYVAWVPEDREAKEALATSYRIAGQVDKAQTLEKELLAATGAAHGGAADSSGGAAKDSNAAGRAPVGAAVAMRVGINFYNDQKYADAADAFRKVIETEPNNRDAIYDLANTYLAMKQGSGLVEAGNRLMAIEPLSEATLQLLGTGYRYINDLDKAVKVAEQLLALPADLTVKQFLMRSDGAKLTMAAIGRAAQTTTGKNIAPVAMPVTFEFLDAKGAIVTAQDSEVPALKPGEANEFAIDAKGNGIVAWRYKLRNK